MAPHRLAIVNEAMAHLMWGEVNPIGRQFQMPTIARDHVELEVVGVVRNAWIKPGRAEARPEVFVPYAQERSLQMAVVIETSDPHGLVDDVMAVLQHLDPLVPVLGPNRRFDQPRPLADIISDALAPWRYIGTLVGAFALLAAILTGAGLYGTLMFEVSRRRPELGLRMALGATPERLVGFMLSQAGRLTLAGIAVGALAASWSTAGLSAWLYEVEPLDVPSFAMAVVAVVAVALTASAIPAWRASRTSPMLAMQAD